MSSKNRFRSNKSNKPRVTRRVRFSREGHLVRDNRVRKSMERLDTILQPENSEILERNLENVIGFTSVESIQQVEETLFKDNDLGEAFDNTFIVKDNGDAVNEEAQKSAFRAVIHTAVDDASREVIESQEETNFDGFVRIVKTNTLERLDTLRTEAEESRDDLAQDNLEKKSLFGKLRDKFKKKINVSGRAVVNMFDAAKKDMEKYAQKLSEKAPTVKSKVLSNKWHQCKKKIVALSLFAVSVLNIGCNSTPQTPQNDAQINNLEQSVDTLQRDSVPTITMQPVQQVRNDTVKVQTEYSDSLGISHAAWLSTQKFDDNSFTKQVDDSTTIRGYVFANQRLTDAVMQQIHNNVASDSLANDSVAQTREQILNAHRYIRSMYPNPDKLEQMGITDSTVVNAATAAKEFDCFLNGDTDSIPHNISGMFSLEQIPGNLNVYATGIDSPCDNAQVKYQKISTPAKEETVLNDSIANELPSDTLSVQTDFDVIPSTLQVDTTVIQRDSTVATNYTLMKSNEGFTNSKPVRDAAEEEVLNRQANDKNIIVEKDDAPQTTFDEVSPASENDSITYTLNKSNENFTNSTQVRTVTAAEVLGRQINNQNVAVERADSVQTDFDDVAPMNNQFVATDTTVVGQQTFDDVKDTTFVASQQFTSSSDSTVVEILMDSDSIEIGTPSAGYVPERGGYNNSGVTLNDINYAKRILGEETYQAIIDNAPEEWFNKGGIAGGLTREEFAVDVAVMNATGPNQATTTAIMESINCGTKLAENVEAQVKADIDGVHINKTRDGWTYKKPIYVRRVNNNGCGKKRTLDQVRTDNRRPTKASGPKFPRMFQRTTVIAQTAFDELPASLQIVNEQLKTSEQPITYTLMKSNEGFTNSKVVRSATEEEVINREVRGDKSIVVENGQAPQKKTKASVLRKRAAKIAQRYEKQAKEAGLSGNMALDMHAPQGAEFVSQFLTTNKAEAETIVNYQTNAKKAQTAALVSIRNRGSNLV